VSEDIIKVVKPVVKEGTLNLGDPAVGGPAVFQCCGHMYTVPSGSTDLSDLKWTPPEGWTMQGLAEHAASALKRVTLTWRVVKPAETVTYRPVKPAAAPVTKSEQPVTKSDKPKTESTPSRRRRRDTRA
jgi:hypothetical protein